jgi:hypothetical protein
MKRVVCRFEDESEFLRQFWWTRAGSTRADFSFVGEFELAPGEQIRLTTLVSRTREQIDLQMRVLDAAPMAIDQDSGAPRLYRHRARVADEDAVWLEMFAKKLNTLRRMDQAA